MYGGDSYLQYNVMSINAARVLLCLKVKDKPATPKEQWKNLEKERMANVLV